MFHILKIQFSINKYIFCFHRVRYKTVLFQAILFSASTQFYLFELLIESYLVLPLWASVVLRGIAIKGYSAFQKLHHYWNLTIRLFCVVYRTLVVGSLTPLQRCSRCILLLQPTRKDYDDYDDHDGKRMRGYYFLGF